MKSVCLTWSPFKNPFLIWMIITKKLTEPSIELIMQEVQHEAKVEEILPQIEVVGKFELSDGDGEAALQTDSESN